MSLSLGLAPLGTLMGNEFDGLYSLLELDLRGCGLTTLPRGVFIDLRQLEHLDVAENTFVDLPQWVMADLVSLKRVWLTLNDQLDAAHTTVEWLGLPTEAHIQY